MSKKIILYCFHHAGGNPMVFRRWQGLLPADVEVCAVEPCWRSFRKNSFDMTMDTLDFISKEIVKKDAPCALYGHSMGAFVALKLAISVQRYKRQILLTFLSGARPPHLFNNAYLQKISRKRNQILPLTGEPGSVQDMKAYQQDLRFLRFLLSKKDDQKVACPIEVFSGNQDELAPPSSAIEWQLYSEKKISIRTFEGGHGFFISARQQMLKHISAALEFVA